MKRSIGLNIMAAAVVLLLLAVVAGLRGDSDSNGSAATAPVVAQQVLVDRTDGPIRYRHIVRANPKVHLHVAEVDLADPRVRVRVCAGGADPDGAGPWQTTLATVRAIAQRERLAVAVNANFFGCRDTRTIAGRRIPYFVGNWASVMGYAMSDGRLWSSKDVGEGTILVDRNGRVRIGYFHGRGADGGTTGGAAANTGAVGGGTDRGEPAGGAGGDGAAGGAGADGGGADGVGGATGGVGDGRAKRDPARDLAPAEAQQMASGFGVLVDDGKLRRQVFDRDVAPRTAVGIDAAGRKLVLLVADGRRDDYSVGLTSEQLANEMIALGCRWVLNLDGGGSSTMVMSSAAAESAAAESAAATEGSASGAPGQIALLNRPSDGHDLPISMSFERAVACAIGVEVRGR